MKKILQFGFSLIILLAMAQWAHSQMPAAISIDPPTATGWDEITLTLDANQACVPDGKQTVIGAPKLRMHSAAFLYNNIANWPSTWGDPGIDYDATPKQEGFDFPELTDNGDGTYSITFIPGLFYGVEEGSTIIGITAVFNGGSWDFEAKDNADDGCGDFYIPLSYDPPTPALKFTLDLRYQEELGNFDKAEQIYRDITANTDFEGTVTAAQAKQRLETMADYQQKVVFKTPTIKPAPKPTPRAPAQPATTPKPADTNQ